MSVTRIFDLLKRYRELYPQKPDALAAKVNGEWVKVSTASFLDSAESMSYGFLQRGVQTGDKIVTIAGIHGTVNKVNDDGTLNLETSPGSYMKIERSSISMEWTANINKPVTEAK